jgi:hypothetical protein
MPEKMTTKRWLIANKDQYPDREELIRRCQESCGTTRGNVLRKLKELGGLDDAPPPSFKGIPLKEGVNVYTQQPQDRTKALIFSLPKGKGFPVIELSKEWNISPETVAKHAKRHDALRYVEESPGNYIKCVMHPDTAAKYHG